MRDVFNTSLGLVSDKKVHELATAPSLDMEMWLEHDGPGPDVFRLYLHWNGTPLHAWNSRAFDLLAKQFQKLQQETNFPNEIRSLEYLKGLAVARFSRLKPEWKFGQLRPDESRHDRERRVHSKQKKDKDKKRSNSRKYGVSC